MRSTFGVGLSAGLILILTILGVSARSGGVASAQTAGAKVAAAQPALQHLPDAVAKPGSPQDPQLLELDHKIKALREEFHSQLDPLDVQIKALHDKYDPQIKDLVSQRKTLAEQSKPSAIQQLDTQEDADLAALSDREKAEIEKVKQSFADQRKELQSKYDAQRKELEARH